MDLYIFRGYLHVRECNLLDCISKSPLRFFILSHYPLYQKMAFRSFVGMCSTVEIAVMKFSYFTANVGESN